MITRIREFRQEKGLTQDDLAKTVGVRRETIVFLEQAKYMPSLELAVNVAKVLGKRIEEIFLFEK